MSTTPRGPTCLAWTTSRDLVSGIRNVDDYVIGDGAAETQVNCCSVPRGRQNPGMFATWQDLLGTTSLAGQ